MIVYALVDDALSPHFPAQRSHRDVHPGRRERFLEEVRGDDPELASYLRIEERELKTSGLN